MVSKVEYPQNTKKHSVFNLALHWRGPYGPIDLQREGHFKYEGAPSKKTTQKVDRMLTALFHGCVGVIPKSDTN